MLPLSSISQSSISQHLDDSGCRGVQGSGVSPEDSPLLASPQFQRGVSLLHEVRNMKSEVRSYTISLKGEDSKID